MDFQYRNVKEKFNDNASQYDSQRRKLIPCFDDFYAIAASVAKTKTEQPSVLDIGAGTGLLSAYVLEKNPFAELTLIDISENMIEQAKKRLKDNPSVTYIVGDYSQYPFAEKYDLVVSSLSIHHLSDEEKKQLYANIYKILNPDGVFVNADQVLGTTPFLENLYKREWQKKVEYSGLSAEELASAYERTRLDKMAALDVQLNWLREIGFTDVDCIYKYFNFVVMYGKK